LTLDDDDCPPDVAIIASAAAQELCFGVQPEVRTRFPGTGKRKSGQTTTRTNVDSPVQPGELYRHVFVETTISSRLLDESDH
jgi:hypothetical protein